MVKWSVSSVWVINRGDKEKRLKNGDKKKVVKVVEYVVNVLVKVVKFVVVLVIKKLDMVNKLF